MPPRYWKALMIGWRILWQGVGSCMAVLYPQSVVARIIAGTAAYNAFSIGMVSHPLSVIRMVSPSTSCRRVS